MYTTKAKIYCKIEEEYDDSNKKNNTVWMYKKIIERIDAIGKCKKLRLLITIYIYIYKAHFINN